MGYLVSEHPLIYVASPLSDMPIAYLEWLGFMNDEALWLFDRGWAPIVPGNDLLFFYRSPRKLTKDDILSIDREYIRASHAIRVIAERHNDGRVSEGVAHEIEFAQSLGKPICRTRKEACTEYERWRTQT
jgi:hypothetical protein